MPPNSSASDAGESEAAVIAERNGSGNLGEPPNWPDDSAESAFLAEAQARGEAVPPATSAAAEPPEETDPKSLPPLDELVKRIPAEVREALDELFRARFVAVRRVPKKALKAPDLASP